MHTPAAAIAWEFRRRHRWGMIAVGVYLAILAAIKLGTSITGHRIELEWGESFAFAVLVPMTSAFVYFLAVFSYGHSGDLAARASIFPARQLTLPVTSTSLAGWPMLLGCAAMVSLWLAVRALAPWPAHAHVPIIWPGVLAASLLAWTQALTWMPYGLTGMRVIVTFLWLAAIDSVVLIALNLNTREPLMLAMLAPHVPLAFFAARHAVARARRGDVPDWRGAISSASRASPTRSRAAFRTARRAQVWYEWRQHGRVLPALVVMVLPFELVLLWAGPDATPFVFFVLFVAMVTPPILAVFTAPAVRVATAFIARRPMTNAAIISAKLEATLWSTVVSWVFVIVAIPVAVAWSHSWPAVEERIRATIGVFGAPRTIVLGALLLVACVASTWRQLVQSLYIGLTGRAWLIKGSVFATLVIVTLIGPLLHVLEAFHLFGALWQAAAWILGVLATIKVLVASRVVVRLRDARLLTDGALLTGAAAWVIMVMALDALFVWFFDTRLIAHYILTLIAILAIPLVRLSAAPLALEWNRHR